MSDWFSTHLSTWTDLYGLCFVVLGFVAYTLPRHDPTLRFARDLRWLGAFGVVRGLLELLLPGGYAPGLGGSWAALLGPAVLAGSYIALLEFGRRSMCAVERFGRWPAPSVHGAALAAAAVLTLGSHDAATGLVLGAKYFVGMPGAFLSGVALIATPAEATERRELRSVGRALCVAGSAFLAYGLLMPWVHAPELQLSGWMASVPEFMTWTFVPVEILRSLCALTATLALVALIRRAGDLSTQDLKRVNNMLNGFVYRCENTRDWPVTYMSGGAVELTGYSAEEFLRNEPTFGGIIHPDDADAVWSGVQRALADKTVYELSYRIIARGGEVRWVYERGRGAFDAQGRLLHLEGHVINDTVRMEAITQLRLKDTAIESSLNAIAMAGLDGTIQYVNTAFCELWGMRREDALTMSVLGLWHDRGAARNAAQQLQRDGRWQGVLQARRADGSSAELQVSASLFFDRAGQPAGALAAFADVTEQLRLAAELAEERDFATSLVANAPVIILLLDAQGKIQHANSYFEDLAGYRLEEIRGKDWFSTFLPERDQPRIRALFESAIGGVRTRADVHPIVTRSGERRDIEWYDQVMRDGQGRARLLLAVGQDITERRRSLEALAASQRTLREILDNVFAFVGLIEADGEVLEINHAPLAAAQLERKDVLGRNLWETPLAGGPEERPVLMAAFQAALEGARVRRDLPVRFGRRRMTLDASFAPIRDESGNVARVVSFGVDVTEQRAMEQQTRRLEAQLQKQQRLEALGTLAGGIAHDFNNLLMIILGNVDAARIHLAQGAELAEDLDGIDRAGLRAQDLVKQILAFGRRQEQVLSRVRIVPILEEALKLLRSTLPARLEVRLTATDPDAEVLADSSQIHQVVMNLVTNAWHAVDDGPGCVEICVSSELWSARSGEASADLEPGRYVRVDVRDTGSGMEPAVLERAFEPFFTTKLPGQGSGLGLSVVHGIMESHNGVVLLESEPGTGTLVRLYFPQAEGSSAAREAPSPAEAVDGHGEHILFVDDEPAIASLAKRLLQSMGYRISCYTSSTQALAAFAVCPREFALAITDYSMPMMSGVELARALLEIRPELPILVMSGFLTPEELKSTADAGIARVMMKPVSFRQLGAAVSDLLRSDAAVEAP